MIRACTSYPMSRRRSNETGASFQSLIENPANRPIAAVAQAAILPSLGDPHGVRSINLVGKTWEPGRTLAINFLDGTPTQKSKVQRLAEEWLQFANLKMNFGAANPDIRISFALPNQSWSLLGTDCLGVTDGAPTINYGWVTDSSDERSDRAVIVHEFGHALSLGHEQSSPLCTIQWDKPKALAYFEQTQGWSAQVVEDNVFFVYPSDQVVSTAYDRDSIMQYPVDPALTLDGNGIGWNTDLSLLDKQHIAWIYPGATTPPVPVAPVAPVKPAPPPVIPPVLTSDVVRISIDGLAVHAPIPTPGKPARFSLTVNADAILSLAVVVDHARGQSPHVVVTPQGERALVLGLVRGTGLFRFDAGNYEVDVYNPVQQLAGTAWVKVTTR